MTDWRGESISELRKWCQDLLRHASPSGALIAIGPPRGLYEPRWGALQGFARPLWGMAALAASGDGSLLGGELWDRWRSGFVAGTNPAHEEYWGITHDNCQAFVEMAPLALSLVWARRELWDRFQSEEQARVLNWLSQINAHEIHGNNWRCFRMLVNAVFLKLGGPVDWVRLEEDAEVLESLAGDDGWSVDGASNPDWRTVDHYIPSAFQTYGLILAEMLDTTRPDWASRWMARAAKFASDWRWFVNSDGAQIAWGRSLSYRWVAGCFWSACVFANQEILPWAEIAWQWRSQKRWWADKTLLRDDGCLSIGYAYPLDTVGESYIAPESPYWLCKIWLALRQPASHPFWSDSETPPSEYPGVRALPTAGGILCASAKNPVLLLAGQCGPDWMAGRQERYGKFAYDTVHGFHLSDGSGPTPDNALLMRPQGGGPWFGRTESRSWSVAKDHCQVEWSPFSGVLVVSTLIAAENGHRCHHRIVSSVHLETLEGGFPEGCIVDEINESKKFFWLQTGHNILREQSRIPVLRRWLPAGTHDLHSLILH